MTGSTLRRAGAQRARRCALDADDIRALLPHRFPFLLLDRVTELEPPRRATGLKSVAVSEPWFAGHFPERMLFPGVLMVECLAQLAGVLIAASSVPENGVAGLGTGSQAALAEIKQIRFHKIVVPGDQLMLQVELAGHTSRAFEFLGTAHVGTTQVTRGHFVLAVQ